jgi:hypothetical protein
MRHVEVNTAGANWSRRAPAERRSNQRGLVVAKLVVVDDLPSKTTVGPLLGLRQPTTARQASQTQRALAIWVTFVVVIMNNIKEHRH